jgi:RNA polymerase sigma factor (sigma-70 family)
MSVAEVYNPIDAEDLIGVVPEVSAADEEAHTDELLTGGEVDMIVETPQWYESKRNRRGDMDLMGTYLHQIGKFPLLSAEEEVELAKAIEAGLFAERLLDGDEEVGSEEVKDLKPTAEELKLLIAEGKAAKSKLISSNARLVVAIAKKMYRGPLQVSDRVQAGDFGLIRGVEKFDYKKGYKFSTYGTWWIRQAISRALADTGHVIRIPVHMHEDLDSFMGTRIKLANELGREPKIEEIAEALDITPEKAQELNKLSKPILSLNYLIGDEEESEKQDLIKDQTIPAPDETVLDGVMQDVIYTALAGLSDFERKVILMRYGLGEYQKSTLDEVAAIFGITRESVRKTENKVLSMLRHPGYSVNLQGVADEGAEQDWRMRAKCKNEVEKMYPDANDEKRVRTSMCIGCKVMKECFETMMEEEIEAGTVFGVRAGLTTRERRQHILAIRRKRGLVNSPALKETNGHSKEEAELA